MRFSPGCRGLLPIPRPAHSQEFANNRRKDDRVAAPQSPEYLTNLRSQRMPSWMLVAANDWYTGPCKRF